MLGRSRGCVKMIDHWVAKNIRKEAWNRREAWNRMNCKCIVGLGHITWYKNINQTVNTMANYAKWLFGHTNNHSLSLLIHSHFNWSPYVRSLFKNYPSFGHKNTITDLVVWNPNPLQSSLLGTTHTSPNMLPLLEGLFWNGIQYNHLIPHDVFSWHKSSSSYQCGF